MDEYYHVDHFQCAHCQSSISYVDFYDRQGIPYCESCYHQLFSVRCAYCNGPIKDRVYNALNKNWHHEHFRCTKCGNKFGVEGYQVLEDMPYCQKCYGGVFAKNVCDNCGRKIQANEPYIEAVGTFWHSSCFVNEPLPKVIDTCVKANL